MRSRRSRAASETLPDSMSTVTPFGATSLHDAIAQTASASATREGRRRAVVVFTDGHDNASRLKPSEVVGHRQRDRRAGLHLRSCRRSTTRRPSSATGDGRTLARGSARRSRGVDGRPRVRGQHAGRTQRGGAADRRRAAASVSHRLRIERQTGLASARGPRA